MNSSKSKLNAEFVTMLYKYYPQTKDLANFLIDTLDLAKESAYRRLRNEVSFTFDEIATIAQSLNFSVDKFIGLNNNKAHLEMELHTEKDPVDLYVKIMEGNIDLIKKIYNYENITSFSALNRLPFAFTLHKRNMVKFFYYKWYFHTQRKDLMENFSTFEVADIIYEKAKEHVKYCNLLKSGINMIIDENIFLYMIREINYFRRRGLITDEDVPELQKDLYDVINMIERITHHGRSISSNNVKLYLSAIDIEPSYAYIEYDLGTSFHIWSPAGDVVTSINPEFCKRQKEWLDSLIRYTTLITQCNERQQIEFLSNQRTHIRNMSNSVHTYSYTLTPKIKQ